MNCLAEQCNAPKGLWWVVVGFDIGFLMWVSDYQGFKVLIRQIHEIKVWTGFETRNKYEILDEENKLIGFAAEQGKGCSE